MAFSTETIGQLLASGRHYISTTVGFIGGVGIMSAAQSKGLSEAFSEIFDGINMILHGATSAWAILIAAFPIIGALMAKIASNSASTSSQAAAVTAAIKDPSTPVSIETKAAVLESAVSLPEVPKIEVTDPVLAQVVPSPQVVPVHP